MELLQIKCPMCHSAVLQSHTTYTTKNHGRRVMYKCDHCPVYCSETQNTFMAGLNTPVSVIWQVLKARTEGMGGHAAARTFEKAKQTILAWESQFVDLHRVRFLSAVVHEFLESVIEGDDASTKVQKNVPPEQSRGWPIWLMDRASRFIWEFACGKRDRRRFQKAIKTLDKIARQTHDRSILTDGERRYGNLLLEICYALGHNGNPGRPKKTCKKGVHVRLKHTGSQAHKKGRKRPRYQSPWREHPETTRTIEETDIHANHAAAFFSALRRKGATVRRKTNTYATSTEGLQRLLPVSWVVHHFLRAHFTTREVPAVALGVLERRLSVREVFHLQVA